MVYFIQSQSGGPIKIGFTAGTNARKRMATLQTGHAHRLILLGTTQAHTEKELHQRFADLRGSGEWFRADIRLIAWIWGHAVLTSEGRLALAKMWPEEVSSN